LPVPLQDLVGVDPPLGHEEKEVNEQGLLLARLGIQ
jgi:hypothetical protein